MGDVLVAVALEEERVAEIANAYGICAQLRESRNRITITQIRCIGGVQHSLLAPTVVADAARTPEPARFLLGRAGPP